VIRVERGDSAFDLPHVRAFSLEDVHIEARAHHSSIDQLSDDALITLAGVRQFAGTIESDHGILHGYARGTAPAKRPTGARRNRILP
jgi:hypothetical protein